MPLALGALAGRSDLAAAAEQLHGLGFDRVFVTTPRLRSELAATCGCWSCAAFWIATTSAIMRIELSAPDGRPQQTWFRAGRKVQTIHHVHGGAALGLGSCLLVGSNDGTIDILPDGHPDWSAGSYSQPSRAGCSFDLDSWWTSRGERPHVPVTVGVPRRALAGSEAITAIATRPRPGAPDTMDMFVATRHPCLYVIEVRAGVMSLQERLPMPGAIEWILCGPRDNGPVVCISRAGDILQLVYDGRFRVDVAQRLRRGVRAMAVPPFNADIHVLLATATDLLLVHAGYSEVAALPVTSSPVVCLDCATVNAHDHAHDYILMGLDDGRVRILDAELLHDFAARRGHEHIAHHKLDEHVTIERGKAILAMESLTPHEYPSVPYVLVVLHDLSVQLFRVTSQEEIRARVAKLWREQVHGTAESGNRSSSFERELAAAAEHAPPSIQPDTWKYMLVDVVLPDLCHRALADSIAGKQAHRQAVGVACGLCAGADDRVLDRLSTGMWALTHDDIDLQLELSLSILLAAPRDDRRRWERFIEDHLRELHALSWDAHEGARLRMVAWTEFVRNHVLRGTSFLARQFELVELVGEHYLNSEHLAALIYQARLAEQRQDLRWDSRVGAEVFGMQTVRGGDRTVVVVATTDGRLVFLDGNDGHWLEVRTSPWNVDRPAPFGARGHARTLACTVACEADTLRIVLSCVARDGRSDLEVFDLRCGPDMTLELIAASRVTLDDGFTEVHALQPLPDRTDSFVAGLTSETPIGLILRQAGRWTLERATPERANPQADGSSRLIERPAPASARPAIRALAAIAIGERYLVISGSHDGLVCMTSFHGTARLRDWQICRWNLRYDAIASIVIGRHMDDDGPDGGAASGFTCYLGTAAGDVFALSVTERDRGPEPVAWSCGDFSVLPLWRDTFDSPILTLQLWCTPLYPLGEVLTVATEAGRARLYQASPVGGSRISGDLGYYFHGRRLDRFAMQGPLRALTVVDRDSAVVAAGRDGRVQMTRLIYLRESVDRADPEPDPRSSVVQSGELPREMWARLHHLFAVSSHDEPFEAAPDRRPELKLRLCDLVDVEHGALRRYALRERLTFYEPWTDLDASGLHSRAHALLQGLDPADPEAAERIKIVLTSLCRAFLQRDPAELCRTAPEVPPDRHADTVAACELVADYVTQVLATPTRTAAPINIVAIKELLRVQALRHMAAPDAGAQRIRYAIASVLSACLRDDDRLVRIEAMRAVSVLLHDVAVMAEAAEDRRDHLVAALFPLGPGSVTWLLDPIIEGLQRFPSYTRRTALVSGAWFFITALLPLFQIFPDHTLALCDYLTRAGLGVEVLAACVQSLRGPRTAAIRARISHLLLIPVLESQTARDGFIEHYDRTTPAHRAMLSELAVLPVAALADMPGREPAWYEVDDAAMADRLLYLLDQLARMWNVQDRQQLSTVAHTLWLEGTRRGVQRLDQATPLAALEVVTANLAAIAGDAVLQDRAIDRLAELSERDGSSTGTTSLLTTPFQTIVSAIVAAWRHLASPGLATTSTVAIERELGAMAAGGMREIRPEVDAARPEASGRPPAVVDPIALGGARVAMNDMSYDYDVALSFAGEDRSHADALATRLTAKQIRVFYDAYAKAQLLGEDLYQRLYDVYSRRARFCVIFVSRSYAAKLWTKHELQAAQERALREKGRAYILPVRIDQTRLPGLPDTTGYLDIGEGVDVICDAVLAKCLLPQGGVMHDDPAGPDR